MRGFLCCCLVSLAAVGATPGADEIEHRSQQLMSQILTAVSTKTDDNALGHLCDMVNDVETAVLGMTLTEDKDADFAVARLRAELDETSKNLSSVRVQHNLTAQELAALMNQHRPLPDQLADAKTRESDFLKQKQLLTKECSEDLDGQRTRVDAIKTDMSVLEDTIEHLSKLSNLGGAQVPVSSLLEVEVEEMISPKCDRASLASQSLGAVVQCESSIIIPLSDTKGTISTLPPGEGMAYHKSRRCVFRVSPAEAEVFDRVELTFLALDTKTDDVVVVYDGPGMDKGNLIGEFSGNTLPPKVRTANSNEMTIVYSSKGGDKPSMGFMANYESVKVPRQKSSSLNECALFDVPIVLTGNGGFISEDSRPEFADALQKGAGTAYSSTMKCKWIIQAQTDETIRLHFTYLNTQPSEYVAVYDGAGESSEMVMQESGTTVPTDVTSSSTALFITFSGDFTVPRKGFHASWCIVGKDCPELPVPELPPPLPIANDTSHNETAPVPPRADPASPVVVQPPSYPLQPPSTAPKSAALAAIDSPTQIGTDSDNNAICANRCSGHGTCQLESATCLCSLGYMGVDCSMNLHTENFNVDQVLIEEDSGVGVPDEAPKTDQTYKDECGDDMADLSADGLTAIDADPVKQLLQDLRFELFRSLSYEHDTTNLTSRQCNRDIQDLDRELEKLQETILQLNKGMSGIDAKIQALREKNQSLATRIQSYKEWSADLTQQIKARKSQTSSRSEVKHSQITSLQAMRDIITRLMGDRTCTKATVVASFTEMPGKLCSGELLDFQKETNDPDDCTSLCKIGSCAGFSFTASEGCKFYSTIESQVDCSPGGPSTCSCFASSVNNMLL